MVLSNLRYMSQSMLPKLTKMLSTKYQVSTTSDLQYLNITVELLESIIIANYTKKQNELLKHVVKRNIFFSGLDWSCLQNPHGTISLTWKFGIIVIPYYTIWSTCMRQLVKYRNR